LYGRYRDDGRGGAAYQPSLLVGVLVYAYCIGDRSSRLIERRLMEDVAYRVVAANARPDHATIARFRADHEEPLVGLFTQVLALRAATVIVRVGVIAVDGTKISADASGTQNLTEERLGHALQTEARRIIDETKAIDAVEDKTFGDARGDELPKELAERSRRLRRLRAAKARLDKATGPGSGSSKNAKAPVLNATDPESRVVKTPTGFPQGFNAQAAVTTDQLIVAAELTSSPIDVHQFEPMLDSAKTNLEAADVGEPIGVVLADAGYYLTINATLDAGCELLIATTKKASLPTVQPAAPPDPRAKTDRAERARAARLAHAFDRTIAGDHTLTAAATEMGLSLSRACILRPAYQRGGIDALVRRKHPNGQGRQPHRTARETLARRSFAMPYSPEWPSPMGTPLRAARLHGRTRLRSVQSRPKRPPIPTPRAHRLH
jgi:transposase